MITTIGISAYASLVLLGQVIGVVTLLYFLWKRDTPELRWIARHSVLLSFIVTLTAVSGTLFFSEIAHFGPCKICWFQRTAMYPLLFLFGTALVLRSSEKIITPFALITASLGSFASLYHYALERVVLPGGPCTPGGGDFAFCATPYFLQFGYITIPMMALSGFLLVILLTGLRSLLLKDEDVINGNL
ncbi:MAG TPA: disulfide bond formation protein B [Candidatus Peribacterales bacterium]|nr:disulfide bond formation protein B [Candidatus Peribacterales bacterium]